MIEYEPLVAFLRARYEEWRESAQRMVGDYYLGEAAEDHLETIETDLAIAERCWGWLAAAEGAPNAEYVDNRDARALAVDVLLILAQQFTGHPEFDPAWSRPLDTEGDVT